MLLSACSPSTVEIISTETAVITENKEEIIEDYSDDGDKITTFKISKKACDEWFGDTTASFKEFLDGGTDWMLEDDFISVTDKKAYLNCNPRFHTLYPG